MKSTITTSTKQPTTTIYAKQSTIPETPLPDLILRQILSNLTFIDIKNCRLVSKQWHRHALDNVNFGLVVERQMQPANQPFSPADNQHRFNAVLIPFPAIHRRPLPERVQLKAVQRPARESVDFYRLRGDIAEAFGPKIRQINLDLANCNGNEIHALILTCWREFAAADFVDGRRRDVQLQFAFEREWQRNGQSTMKLRELRCPLPNSLAQNAAQCIIMPFFRVAENVSTLQTCEMQRFQAMLNNFERNFNNNQPLFFPACENLSLQWSHGTFAPFDKISGCFNNVVQMELRIFDGVHQIDADFGARLQQQANLKRLKIVQPSNSVPPLRLTELCLPNLVTLRLAGPQLSANPVHFDSTRLQELCVQGDFNIVPLAAYARYGLRQLTTLELHSISAASVDQFLPPILKAAKGLQELTVKGRGFELATAACIKAAHANLQKLRLLTVGGDVVIPPDVGRLQFVQEIVRWQSATGLNVPLVFDCFMTTRMVYSLLVMAGLQSEIDVNGTSVKFAAASGTFCEMAWRNKSSGAQQKLVVRRAV